LRVSASGSGVSSSAIGSAEGGLRLVADPTSATAAAFRDSNRPGAVSNIPVAVSAHDPSQRAALAPSAPSDARTQGDRNSSAIRSTEDEAARSVRGGDSAVRGRGEWAPFPPSTTPSARSLLSSYIPAAAPLPVDRTHNEHISRFARRTEESDCDCLLAPHSSRKPCGRPPASAAAGRCSNVAGYLEPNLPRFALAQAHWPRALAGNLGAPATTVLRTETDFAGRSADRAAPDAANHGNCVQSASPSTHSLRSGSLRALRVTASRLSLAGPRSRLPEDRFMNKSRFLRSRASAPSITGDLALALPRPGALGFCSDLAGNLEPLKPRFALAPTSFVSSAAELASRRPDQNKPTAALLPSSRTHHHRKPCDWTPASAAVGSQRERLGDLNDPARDSVASANGWVFVAEPADLALRRPDPRTDHPRRPQSRKGGIS
jgi:hypothetical protein